MRSVMMFFHVFLRLRTCHNFGRDDNLKDKIYNKKVFRERNVTNLNLKFWILEIQELQSDNVAVIGHSCVI